VTSGGGGASPISFYVGAQNGQCIAYNSSKFQPVALIIGPNGQGNAGVVGLPGGVAITNATLTVYGRGGFTMTGLNYAGNFWFTCTP